MQSQFPDTAERIDSYAELKEVVAAFVAGKLNLVVIGGPPGVCKSQTVRRALGGQDHMLLKGAMSPIQFYTRLYERKDQPVVLDDADETLKDRRLRSYVKALCETDQWRRLDYDTKALDETGIPRHFYTSSPVCIISNWWKGADPICQAIASRAHFFVFRPTWAQVYENAAEWFWDQEIADYLHKRLDVLREPDVRILTKAADRKAANMKARPWQAVIDAHLDDKTGLLIRELLADKSLRTNDRRAAKFVETDGGARSTFYLRMKEIRAYAPTAEVPRLKLRHKSRPIEARPADGPVSSGDSDEDDGEDGLRVFG